MNIPNLQKLRAEIARIPAEALFLGEERQAGCTMPCTFVAWANALVDSELTLESGDVESPSLASWLGLTYTEVMDLFFMQPADAPINMTRADLRNAAVARRAIVDDYDPPVRKAVILSVLDRAIETRRIDWPAAKRDHGLELAA